MSWRPTLGAVPLSSGVQFRVWAPDLPELQVAFENGPRVALKKSPDGTFAGKVPDIRPGALYRFMMRDKGPFPDPVSRFQPQGVHGPSEIIDPSRFAWTDQSWKGVPLRDLVFYELHVGTFTPEGTFAALSERLPYLADLGITAVELMPVADFPGRWNWGYDGVAIFAPARCYGRPDDLRRLVNEAHRLGLAVFLDVVYNHLGPDGNYLGVYSPYYFSEKHHTAWGQALNFDGPHNERVREFFIENALHWIHEYHFDGLRLDATHAILDDSERKFLAELSDRVHGSVSDRQVHLIAEDHRNLNYLPKPTSRGGWGLDGVWADDFHHQMRRLLAGDNDGYFSDYTDNVADLAATIRQGWLYCGQLSQHLNEPRGTDSSGVSREHMVYCLQNHDQVGNRAFGERLNQQIDSAAFRAASVLLLCCPATPLLFMGQEWAAGTPFLFFTDHKPELGKMVTEGRRKEFRHFAAFADPKVRERIPDPQAPATFEASRLNWDERIREPHACMLNLYQELLRLRRQEPALHAADPENNIVSAVGESGILLRRRTPTGSSLVIAVQLRGAGDIDIGGNPNDGWDIIFDTENPHFSPDPRPISFERVNDGYVAHFPRPGAVVIREGSSRSV